MGNSLFLDIERFEVTSNDMPERLRHDASKPELWQKIFDNIYECLAHLAKIEYELRSLNEDNFSEWVAICCSDIAKEADEWLEFFAEQANGVVLAINNIIHEAKNIKDGVSKSVLDRDRSMMTFKSEIEDTEERYHYIIFLCNELEGKWYFAEYKNNLAVNKMSSLAWKMINKDHI